MKESHRPTAKAAAKKAASSSPQHQQPAKRQAPLRQGPLEFADQLVEPGTAQRIEIPVARLPIGNFVSLQVVVVRGSKPGPVVWLSAAVHGDELNGIIIVEELVTRLSATEISGTVLAVPVVNAFGLIQGSRYLPDRRDLNRSFPGSKRGSLAGRLAHLLTEHVIAPAQMGIDFHTGSGGRNNLPQIRCDLDDAPTRELARTFGTPVALHAELRDGSLRSHAAKLGKPCLVFEGGEAGRLHDSVIQAGVEGTLRALAAVDVLAAKETKAHPPTQFFRSSSWVRAARTGFCRLNVELGQWVNQGATVGTIINPALASRHSITARKTGVVICHVTEGLVNAGDAIIHIAESEPE